jgi:hypothetical protein
MVDAVNSKTTVSTSVQRPQQSGASQSVNRRFAQTILNLPDTANASKGKSQATQQGTKSEGFSTKLPRGSLVDILA